MQVFDCQALAFCWVPGAGIEPARIAPLVFETSASTDSAIRAGALSAFGCLRVEGVPSDLRSAKVSDFSEIAKYFFLRFRYYSTPAKDCYICRM